ncbi:MAG: hypothetical protein GXP22_06545 [Gammaproteobacteria bacterium]|nr:hypothetical protein [Gammaproteobacteria bacterium]
MSQNEFSDDFINAYIDNELGVDDRARLLDQIRDDESLAGRVCQLQKVKEMTKNAYDCIEVPTATVVYKLKTPWTEWATTALAASVLLSVGVLGGWYTQSLNHSPNLLEFAETVEVNHGLHDNPRLVLHVTTNDPVKLATVLEETESLLKRYEGRANQPEVEILANGQGLGLLRVGGADFAERINALQSRYDNLAFLACKKTIDRLKSQYKTDVNLLPGVKIVPSALGEMIDKKQQGWAYIKI